MRRIPAPQPVSGRLAAHPRQHEQDHLQGVVGQVEGLGVLERLGGGLGCRGDVLQAGMVLSSWLYGCVGGALFAGLPRPGAVLLKVLSDLAARREDSTMNQAAPTLAKACPRCGSHDTTRSHRNVLERLLGLLWRLPYRCRACRERFWRFG